MQLCSSQQAKRVSIKVKAVHKRQAWLRRWTLTRVPILHSKLSPGEPHHNQSSEGAKPSGKPFMNGCKANGTAGKPSWSQRGNSARTPGVRATGGKAMRARRSCAFLPKQYHALRYSVGSSHRPPWSPVGYTWDSAAAATQGQLVASSGGQGANLPPASCKKSRIHHPLLALAEHPCLLVTKPSLPPPATT